MPETLIEVEYPTNRGGIVLRGAPPLSWTASSYSAEVSPGRHVFKVDVPVPEIVEFKLLRQERDWSCGRNFSVQAGGHVLVRPHFDCQKGILDHEGRHHHSPQLGRDVGFRVFLPPTYYERPDERYPVLYAQDAQALFSDRHDPIDGQSWRMDEALNELWELRAAQEMIVVGVYTDFERLEMLSPMPDPRYGGGRAPQYRDFIIETLKPHIDATFRTLPDRENTALIGASLGGLFSFWSSWTRPEVFGKAACLSSSFWWNCRALVEMAQKERCPVPPPTYYIDSGAAKSALEEDANRKDGYHHTQSMRKALLSHCYEVGKNLHVLAFAGMAHNNGAWASRLQVPLQLLFPRRPDRRRR
jgi:predicted alpha/beta superfamily hydrolase